MGACSSTTEPDADYLMHNNFHYSTALAIHAFKNKARFIYASSAATYGDGALGYADDHDVISKLRPMNCYGFSKNLFDSWALDRGYLDSVCGLRFFNVYGPNEYHKGAQSSVVFKAWKSIKDTGAMTLFKSNTPQYKDGEQKRDFVYVKDCTEVLWRALQDRSINGVFNLGTGTARSWLDLVRAVFAALKAPEKINFAPLPESLSKHYQNFTEAKMDKLRAAGAFPTNFSLEDGVCDYVVNYLEKSDQYL
jgi:ADP-L-glycero-D-manno-heptose 6-epimerase